MKQLIALVLTAGMTVACASQKAPAEMALKGLEQAVTAATPEIEMFAADRMTGLTDAVGAAKKKLEGGDYAGVVADVQTVTAQLSAAAQAAAAKKADLTTEWATFAALPAMVGQVTAKLTELTGLRRLPAGMTKTTVDDARASLDKVNALWSEASGAFEKGDLMAAVARARDIKPMVDALMSSLGVATAAAAR
ncbi:MAG: hypothetical protein JNL48_10830 [Acidobacteria bacterium]|nr:hypothetical protein [Acidobacteriota bacterium]